MSISDFIKDENELKKFYEAVLVPLEQDEVYYIMLAARSKYNSSTTPVELKKGSDMLKRITLRKNDFNCFRNCILELFAPTLIGRYVCKKGNPLPLSTYVSFITTNPRNTRRACLGIVNKITEGLMNTNTTLNIENMMLSEIHKSVSRKVFLEFDVDVKGNDDGDKARRFVENSLGDSEYHTLKTRGGYHILLKTKNIDSKIKNTFYRDIQEYSNNMEGEVEMKGSHMMTPIGGVTQGGFTPYIMDKE